MWLATRGLNFSKSKKHLLKLIISGYLLHLSSGLWHTGFALFAGICFRAHGLQNIKFNALWTLSFGYLMNLTIPRSGEVARATALYGVEKVPVDKSFGTIILERVVDLFFMMLFLLLTAIFKYEALISFYNYLTKQKENAPQQEQGFPWKWLIAGCIGLEPYCLLLFVKVTANFDIR